MTGYLTAGLQSRRGDDLNLVRHVFYQYLHFNCETNSKSIPPQIEFRHPALVT